LVLKALTQVLRLAQDDRRSAILRAVPSPEGSGWFWGP